MTEVLNPNRDTNVCVFFVHASKGGLTTGKFRVMGVLVQEFIESVASKLE